jgi:hypothetical protein
VIVTQPAHRDFKSTYFRRYYGYEEQDFVTGFQNDDAKSIGERKRMPIRQRPGHTGTRQKEMCIKNRKKDKTFAVRKLMGPDHQVAVFMFFFFLSLCSFFLLIWNFRLSFCTHEDRVPYRSSAQMSFREEAGVSFFCTRNSGTANSTPLISISRNLAPFDKLGWKTSLFFSRACYPNNLVRSCGSR